MKRVVETSSALSRGLLIALLGLSVGVVGCTSYAPVYRDGSGGARHVVKRGDSVSLIAQRYGVGSRDIALANGLRNPDLIFVGQVLTIPSRGTSRASQQVAARPAAPSPARTVARSTVSATPASGSVAGASQSGTAPTVLASRGPAPLASSLPPTGSIRPAGDAPSASGPAVSAEPLPSPVPAQPRATGVASAPSAPAVASRPHPSPVPMPSAEAVQAAAERSPPALSGDGFLWPVAGKVISGFGNKPNRQRNDGVNIAVGRGTPILAAEHGVVVYAGSGISGFGNMVLLKHADNFTTAYAHADRLDVAVGDVVRRGQILGSVGATGEVGSAQLHFELRSGRMPLDPQKHLVERPRVIAGVDGSAS
jgi:murein DD-endopeptidase MepM/ murein hydrolase activator NlpD